jgi:DNA-binding MurR/RpiR family transcriptional regulator
MKQDVPPMTDLQSVIDHLTGSYPRLSPMLKRAAKYVLDSPAEVATTSMRGLAAAADIAPSTMLRLAKTMGFPSYEAFREPFRDAVRVGGGTFGARAEWLQTLAHEGDSGEVLKDMAQSAIDNLERAFRAAEPATLIRAADLLRQARVAYVVGAGPTNAIARYFYLVGRMALPNLVVADAISGSMIDELAHTGPDDVLVAISTAPYARDTVQSTEFARSRGTRLIAVTDSRASPLAHDAEAILMIPTSSPQFFPSQTATIAMLESLLAFAVSRGDRSTVEKIAQIERLRFSERIYWQAHDP